MRLKLKVKSNFGTPAQDTLSLEDMIRQAIEAENDAICQYRQYAEVAVSEDAKKIFKELADDERVHSEMLQDFLHFVNPKLDLLRKEAKDELKDELQASAPAIRNEEAMLDDAQSEVIEQNQDDFKQFVQDKATSPDDNASKD